MVGSIGELWMLGTNVGLEEKNQWHLKGNFLQLEGQKERLGSEFLRAVIYTRVSTKGQEDNFSIDAQERRCKAWLEGMFPESKVVEIYHEVGSGGSVDGRPIYQKMMQDMYEDKWDLLIFFKLDRLHRNMKKQKYFAETYLYHHKALKNHLYL